MRKDEIIEIIKSYKTIMPEIRSLNEQLNDYLESTVKAITISDMPKTLSNKISDPVGELVARYGEDISVLTKTINDLLNKKEFTEKMISILDYTEKQIIIYRYINNPNHKIKDIYEWIGVKMNYSRRQVINIHNRAIEKIALNCTKKAV